MARTFTAKLHCGTVLSYDARSFLPAVGEVVPCRSHGYCPVRLTGTAHCRGRGGGSAPRATPRGQNELLEWLRDRPVTTVHALRRQRFTLRMLAAAERAGLVQVDLHSGRVMVRSVPVSSG